MNIETQPLREALLKMIIEDHNKPVIAEYEIVRFIYTLYRDKEYDGVKIGKIKQQEPDFRVISNSISNLLSSRVMTRCKNLPIYQLTSKNKATAQQIICSLNPCSYLSYLSAMEWHGITDRIPNTLHLVASTADFFKTFHLDYLKKNFPEGENLTPLTPKRIVKSMTIEGKEVNFHQRKNAKIPKEQFNSGGIKVSTLGETFLDMLKYPDLCGGFDHVIDIFEEYGEQYLSVIVNDIDKNGSSMDKARAGYILEEICNLSHKKIELWKAGVQRGGTRRLIPNNAYTNVYSEVWCISINR